MAFGPGFAHLWFKINQEWREAIFNHCAKHTAVPQIVCRCARDIFGAGGGGRTFFSLFDDCDMSLRRALTIIYNDI